MAYTALKESLGITHSRGGEMKYKCYFCGTKDEDEWAFSTLFEYRICRSCVEKVVNYLKERIEIDPT